MSDLLITELQEETPDNLIDDWNIPYEQTRIQQEPVKQKGYQCVHCNKVLKTRGSYVKHLTSRNSCEIYPFGLEFHCIVQNIISTVDILAKEQPDSEKYARQYQIALQKLEGMKFYISRTKRELELLPEYNKIKINFENGIKRPFDKQ